MSMSAGTSHGSVSEINVTPLIDVLLVLLIIFMVIVPVVPKGLDALVPQPARPEPAAAPAPERTIVVQVLASASGAVSYEINQQRSSQGEVLPKLAAILATRQDKAMFVQGDKDLDYSKVAEVVAYGRQAGADRVGLLTPGASAR